MTRLKIFWIIISIPIIQMMKFLLEEETLEFLIAFKDFEDVIMLSNRSD